MQPHQHPNCNDVLKAPIGDNECDDLPIMREPGQVWSFWQPTTEEKAAIACGGSIALRVVDVTHPPLSLHVMPPDGSVAWNRTVEDLTVLHAAHKQRYVALMMLTKSIVGAWNREGENAALKGQLSDQFLDHITKNRDPREPVRDYTVEPTTTAGVTQADVERYRSDAEWFRSETHRLDGQLEAIRTALGDTIPFDCHINGFAEAITALKNRLATAEAARDQWQTKAQNYADLIAQMRLALDEAGAPTHHPQVDGASAAKPLTPQQRILVLAAMRNTAFELHACEQRNLENLLHYVEGREGHVPVSGKAITIRDALLAKQSAGIDPAAIREKILMLDMEFGAFKGAFDLSVTTLLDAYRYGWKDCSVAVTALPELNPAP